MNRKPPPLPSVSQIVDEVLNRARKIKKHKWGMIALIIGAAIFPILVLKLNIHFLVALMIVMVGFMVAGWLSGRSIPSSQEILQDIGSQNPKLHYLLSTAHQQEQRNGPESEPSYLEKKVVQEAVNEALDRRIAKDHSVNRLKEARYYLAAGFLVYITSAMITSRYSESGEVDSSISSTETGDGIVTENFEIVVTPGDVEVEKESRLVVTAMFKKDLPETATLVMESSDGEYVRRIPMKQKLQDPEFGATIEEIPGDGVYRIELDENGLSDDYEITTYELPRLVQADISVKPPAGSERPRQETKDTQRARIYQGDSVDWSLHLNKPATAAKLVAKDGKEIVLTPNAEEPCLLLASTKPDKSARYELFLTDDAGRDNRNPPYLSVLVKQNRPAKITLNFPNLDSRVTPIQEITPAATVTDDLGIKSAGVTFRFNGKMEEVIFDTSSNEQLRKRKFTFPLDFESLNARPNTLLTYYFWAEDEGPDTNMRRTESDMYFLEVRHFEEIYREAGGKPKKGGDCDCKKLLKLQKQLINATWKKQRGSQSDKNLAKDGLALWNTQEYIIKLLDGL